MLRCIILVPVRLFRRFWLLSYSFSKLLISKNKSLLITHWHQHCSDSGMSRSLLEDLDMYFHRYCFKPVLAAPGAGSVRWCLNLVIVFCLLAWTTISIATEQHEGSILDDYPGQKVSIGDHALHIDCRGYGSPVVILESGLGGFSSEWKLVQDRLSNRTRVCAYDRAGYGWSDDGPLPRTATRNMHELKALLAAAGEQPPYLLVGQSYGGFVVRLFAEHYANEVSGVVLLDASSPEQFTKMPEHALPHAIINARRKGIPTLTTPRPISGLSESQQVTVMQLMMLPKARRAYHSEMQHFQRSARRVSLQKDGTLKMPLIVVSRTRQQIDGTMDNAQAERIWQLLQQRMTELSPRSDHWLAAGAGHLIHIDRPDLVALAIRQAAEPELPSTVTAYDSMARLIRVAQDPPNGRFTELSGYYQASGPHL